LLLLLLLGVVEADYIPKFRPLVREAEPPKPPYELELFAGVIEAECFWKDLGWSRTRAVEKGLVL